MNKVERDSDGNEVRDGDLIRFAYGLPPVGVEARVVERGGKLIALTPHHKPEQCPLTRLRRYVGDFYRIEEKPYKHEIERRIFAARHRITPSAES